MSDMSYFIPGRLYELIGSTSFDKFKHVPIKSKLVFLFSKIRKENFHIHNVDGLGNEHIATIDVVDLYFSYGPQFVCVKGTSLNFNTWQTKFRLI